MATNTLSQVAVDFEEYARQTTALKNKLDWQAYMVGAKREGRAEEKLEIARKMKEMGETVEKIHIFTGLPTESIKQM